MGELDDRLVAHADAAVADVRPDPLRIVRPVNTEDAVAARELVEHVGVR